VRPSDYAKFVRTRRFKTRKAVPSTPNSVRDRLLVDERRAGRQGQRQPPAGLTFQNGPYQAGHRHRERSLRLPGHSHAVKARLRKGTARFWACSDPTGRARRTRNARHGLNAALPAATANWGRRWPRPARRHPFSGAGRQPAVANVTKTARRARQQGWQGGLDAVKG